MSYLRIRYYINESFFIIMNHQISNDSLAYFFKFIVNWILSLQGLGWSAIGKMSKCCSFCYFQCVICFFLVFNCWYVANAIIFFFSIWFLQTIEVNTCWIGVHDHSNQWDQSNQVRKVISLLTLKMQKMCWPRWMAVLVEVTWNLWMTVRWSFQIQIKVCSLTSLKHVHDYWVSFNNRKVERWKGHTAASRAKGTKRR